MPPKRARGLWERSAVRRGGSGATAAGRPKTKTICASHPSASPEARSGIAEMSFVSASAKDRQAPLSSMRKRPQPREVLPVCLLALVSPPARIAAPRAEMRSPARRKAAADYAYALEDRGGAVKER